MLLILLLLIVDPDEAWLDMWVAAPAIDKQDLGLERFSGASGSEGETERARDDEAIDEDIDGGRDAGEVCPCVGGVVVSGLVSESRRCN